MAPMSAPERAQFLSRVLGYERIREAQGRLKERRAVLRSRVETLRAGLVDLAELDAADASTKSRLTRARKAEGTAQKGFARERLSWPRYVPGGSRPRKLREAALALETRSE